MKGLRGQTIFGPKKPGCGCGRFIGKIFGINEAGLRLKRGNFTAYGQTEAFVFGFGFRGPGFGEREYRLPERLHAARLTFDLSVITHGVTPNNAKRVLHGCRTDGKNSGLYQGGPAPGTAGSRTVVGDVRRGLCPDPGDYVFVVSPLTRARQTFDIYAEYIHEKSGTRPASEEDPEVREIDFGSWDGYRPDELRGGERELAERYRSATPLSGPGRAGRASRC